MSSYNIAIVGATGAVGEEILRVLDEINFPVKDILPLASAKSAGEKVEFRGKEYVVRELTDSTFDENEIDIAFFSAGGSISAHYVPFAAASGAVVIDNTSHFRMQEDVPRKRQKPHFARASRIERARSRRYGGRYGAQHASRLRRKSCRRTVFSHRKALYHGSE